MTTPNTALQAVRLGRRMSLDDLARALRAAGAANATKRTVQRWESGEVTAIRPSNARALEKATGHPIEVLGFDAVVPLARVFSDDGGGHDVSYSPTGVAGPASGTTAAHRGNYSGIWLSRYQYFSSGREETYTGAHYVLLLQHGDRLTVSSLPQPSGSQLRMDMTLDGNVITGTWVEQTAEQGYYRGARYHGAIQMLAEPTARRLIGKWVGFGKSMDVNTGPWELIFQDASTSRTTLERYSHGPE